MTEQFLSQMDLNFAIGSMSGIVITLIVCSMIMKRGGWRSEDSTTPPGKRPGGVRSGIPQLRTRRDAETIRKARVTHLIWVWIYGEAEGEPGEWRLRPLLPPSDAQGNIHTYKWSKRRQAYMLDQSTDRLSKIEGSWEMIDFYSKKREQEDKEGPGANGEWVDLKMEIEGYDLEPEGYELQVEPPPARQVKVEPE